MGTYIRRVIRKILLEESYLLNEGVEEERDLIRLGNQMWRRVKKALAQGERFVMWPGGNNAMIEMEEIIGDVDIPSSIVWLKPILRDMKLTVGMSGGYAPEASYEPGFNILSVYLFEPGQFEEPMQHFVFTRKGQEYLSKRFDDFKRKFIHELRHVYQYARSNHGIFQDMIRTVKDYESYINHPTEVDARILMLLDKIEDMEHSPTDVASFVIREIGDDFDKMTVDNQRIILKRVGRYVNQ